MTDTYKQLAQAQPGTGVGNVLAPASGTQCVISKVVASNPTAGDLTVAFYGNGTADSNCLVPPTTIPAGGSWPVPLEGICINGTEGDTLKAKASSATSITVTVYGVAIT